MALLPPGVAVVLALLRVERCSSDMEGLAALCVGHMGVAHAAPLLAGGPIRNCSVLGLVIGVFALDGGIWEQSRVLLELPLDVAASSMLSQLG